MTRSLVGVCVLGVVLAGCGSPQSPTYLTTAGRGSWHFEQYLRERYGERVCTSRTNPSGYAAAIENACTPLAEHSPYFYLFSGSGLTREGQVRWNLEALLHDEFGNVHACDRYVGPSTSPGGAWGPNFVRATRRCTGSSPYLFSGARHSSFHLVTTHQPSGFFGVHPVLVRVDNRYVACDPHARTYLIWHSDSANRALGCVAPL